MGKEYLLHKRAFAAMEARAPMACSPERGRRALAVSFMRIVAYGSRGGKDGRDRWKLSQGNMRARRSVGAASRVEVYQHACGGLEGLGDAFGRIYP